MSEARSDAPNAEGRAPVRASKRLRRFLLIPSAEGTRMKGLVRIPADRREAAIDEMLRRAR